MRRPKHGFASKTIREAKGPRSCSGILQSEFELAKKGYAGIGNHDFCVCELIRALDDILRSVLSPVNHNVGGKIVEESTKSEDKEPDKAETEEKILQKQEKRRRSKPASGENFSLDI